MKFNHSNGSTIYFGTVLRQLLRDGRKYERIRFFPRVVTTLKKDLVEVLSKFDSRNTFQGYQTRCFVRMPIKSNAEFDALVDSISISQKAKYSTLRAEKIEDNHGSRFSIGIHEKLNRWKVRKRQIDHYVQT